MDISHRESFDRESAIFEGKLTTLDIIGNVSYNLRMSQKTAHFLAVLGIGILTLGLFGMGYVRATGSWNPSFEGVLAYLSKSATEDDSSIMSQEKTVEILQRATSTLDDADATSTTQTPSKVASKSPFSQIRDVVASVLSKPKTVTNLTRATSTSVSPDHTADSSSVPVSVGHSQFVYMRGLVGGWIPSTSDVQATFNAPGMSGSLEAASVVLSAAKDTVRWNRPGGVDTKEYEGILLWIRGSVGAEQVRITLFDTSGAVLGSANAADYIPSRKISATEYQRAFIPFQAINPKRSIVGSIGFSSTRATKFSIDSLTFSNAPDGVSLAGLLHNTQPTVFDSDFRNTWELENTGISSKIVSTDEADSGYALLAKLPKKGDTISLVNTLNMFSSSLKSFVLNMRGRDAYDHQVTITFYDENGIELGHVRLKSYTTQEKEDFKKVQKVTIPLSDLGVGRNYIKKITFTAEEGQIQELRLSDIRFEL